MTDQIDFGNTFRREHDYGRMEMNKRKLCWTFEGKGSDGSVKFPKSFVKLSDRPPFPYSVVGDEHGGHKEYTPGDVLLEQFFDKQDDAMPLIDEAQQVTQGVLCCILGGKTHEQWQLNGVNMEAQAAGDVSQQYYGEQDEFLVDWLVKYQSSDLKGVTDQPLDGARNG